MDSEDDIYLSDNSNNTLYQSYKDAHPSWLFVGNSVLKTLYIVPRILLNFSLLWITFKSKSLQGTAKYLLALNSLFELLHQPGQFVSIFTALSGLNFINYPLAVHLCSVSLFGLVGFGPSLFFTGVDRLLAVTFFTFYQRINTIAYLLAITCLCSLYSGYVLFLVYKVVGIAKWQNHQVTGNLGDLFQEDASQFYYVNTFILNAATIVIYIFVGVYIHFQTADLFRSLLAIISFGVGGYFLMRLYTNFIVPNVTWSATTIWTVRQAFAIPKNISAGSNAAILYWTSIEYRKAYRKELTLFVGYLRRQNWINAGIGNNNNNNVVQVIT